MQGEGKRNIVIIDESLSYFDENGLVDITSKFSLAILAVVATSPGQRCSRELLKRLLWPNSPHPHNTNCLRQAIFKLRGELNQNTEVLFADSKHVRLKNVSLEVSRSDHLLTALPFIDKRFDLWLKEFNERDTKEQRTQLTVKPDFDSCPIYLFLGESIPPSPSHDAIISLATDRFAINMQWNGVLELFDNRQSPYVQNQQGLHVGLAIYFKLTVCAGVSQLTAFAINTLSQQIVWTESLAGDDSSTLTMSSERISVFIANTVDSLAVFVANYSFKKLPEEKHELLDSIKMVSSLESEKVLGAIKKLKNLSSESDPVVEAWLGFAYMLLCGESMVKDRLSAQLAASDYILSALSRAPGHPFVLAVAGHFFTFYKRDFQYADELLRKAMSIAPNMAVVRDTRGLLCLYNDDFETASHHIDYAVKLSSANSLKNYIAASKVMLLTNLGQHESSVNLAERILYQHPDFEAVKRYAFCSLAQIGELSKAEPLYEQIVHRSPGLLEKQVKSNHTPLVSESFSRLFQNSAKIFA